jgi:glycine/D-amino acid oxidase-like deaminating enzyme
MAQHEAWLQHAREYQLDSRLISGAEVADLMPGAAQKWLGALYTPSDGRAEPQIAAPAIAQAARQRGASILTSCAVRGIETEGGKVSAVVTERGKIACRQVVLAGGAWSRRFCDNLGVRLPQLKVLASVMRTEKLDGAPEISATGTGFGFRKRLDGGYNVSQRNANIFDIVPDAFRFFGEFLPTLRAQGMGIRMRVGGKFIEEWQMKRRWGMDEVSPFEQVRVLDPEPSATVLDEAQANIGKAFPAFANMKVAERWAGMIDVTPDAIPVMSEVQTLPGFFIATGFSGHGFGIGPGAGRLMADLVTGAAPVVDPTPFRYSRFTDGTKNRPYGTTV